MSDSSTSQAVVNDCWNKIGVWGDGSCEKLVKHVHCRNCPVYSSAASQLLDREVDQDYLQAGANYYSLEKDEKTKAVNSAVIFRIGNEWFGLRPNIFQQVAEQRLIHTLPHRRNQVVLGLANIRGELLVCVSLAKFFGVDEAQQNKSDKKRAVYERLLVASVEGNRLAFPVDEVQGIFQFAEDELKEVPPSLARAKAVYTKSILLWQEKSVGLLDADILFYALNKTIA